MQIILASASKRRQDILKSLGIKFKVVVSDLDEKRFKNQIKDPIKLVKKLALEKALAVRQQIQDKKISEKEYLIISADQVIGFKNKDKFIIFGKPKNKKEAIKMLHCLKAKTHKVYTGVAIINSHGKKRIFCEISRISFRNFSEEELQEYLKTNTYLDRAGAYGIQDKKCRFVKRYQGSYSNIVGLPLEKLVGILKEFGVRIN